MHIPDNYLSPSTCAVMFFTMAPVWYYSIKKVKEHVSQDKIPLIGVGAAFSFMLMMFNLPIPDGTTAHAVGGTLIALLLGPYAACVAVSVALLIQALIFGDGGILSFGANCFNMAFVLPFVGYYLYRLFTKLLPNKIAIFLAAYIGINLAAFCASVEFGIQPLLFTDAMGQPLYCPYPLWVSIPAMIFPHLTIAGIAEGVFTVALYSFMLKVSPGIVRENQTIKLNPIFSLLVGLIVLSPLGLLASGTAWGEWGADEIADDTSAGSALGFVPDKLANGFNYEALLPDYALAGLPDIVGYILSAVVGVALLIVIFKVIGSIVNDSKKTA